MPSAVRGLTILLTVIALALAVLYAWARTSLPETDGRLVLAGLSGEVTVARDEYGVPLITASSQEDAFFGLGFVHAQDRLWQLEFSRLRGRGRLAELLGDRAVPEDRLHRGLGLYQAAERDLAGLSSRAVGLLQAYCDGINGYLAERRGALPPEFLLLGHSPSPWTPADVVARWKLLAWEEAGGWREELLRAQLLADSGVGRPPLPPAAASRRRRDRSASRLRALRTLYRRLPLSGLRDVLPPGPVSWTAGSRAWVLSGEHTVDGTALLAHDLHGPAQAPAPWYLMQLSAPGLDVFGATIPGLPAVFSGRSERIAWAITGERFDSQDLYVERLSPRSGEEEAGLEARSELLTVRGGDDVEFTIRRSRHGPLLNDLLDWALEGSGEELGRALQDSAEEYGLALSWTALHEGDRSLQGALDLLFARDWNEFRDALRNLHEPATGFLYADVDGNVGYQQTGRRPLRRGDGSLPSPGWDERWDWTGFARFGRQENLLNPSLGRVVRVSPISGETPDEWASLAIPPPAEAVDELIAALEHHTAESLAHLLGRRVTPAANGLLPVLLSARPNSDVGRRAQAVVAGWHGEARDSAAWLLFRSWYGHLSSLVFRDELGAELVAAVGLRPEILLRAVIDQREWCDDRGSAEVEDCSEMSGRALDRAAAELSARFGSDFVSWPRTATSQSYSHPVFETTALAGLFEVKPPSERQLRARDARPGTAGTGPDAQNLPAYRAVYDLSPPGRSRYLLATGQSGNPISADYRSFRESWGEGRLLALEAGAPERVDSGEIGRLLVLEPRR